MPPDGGYWLWSQFDSGVGNNHARPGAELAADIGDDTFTAAIGCRGYSEL